MFLLMHTFLLPPTIKTYTEASHPSSPLSHATKTFSPPLQHHNSHDLRSPQEIAIASMEVESVKCVCCGLREDCTEDYISSVKANFDGEWLCGLCSEAVRDELSRGRRKINGVQEAIKAHMSFCSKSTSNPAIRVVDGMRQMLRRRSGELSRATSAASPKKFGRMASSSQVGDESSFY